MIKNIDIQEKEKGILEVNVTIEDTTVNNYYNTAVNKVQSQAKIKGYRTGKVPKALILKTHEPQIKYETINAIFPSLFDFLQKEHQIQAITTPSISGYEDYVIGEDLKLTLTIETPPTVENIPSLDSIHPEKVEYQYYIEEEVNTEIEMLRGLHTHYHDCEEGSLTDVDFFVKVKYKISGENLDRNENTQYFALKKEDPYWELSQHFLNRHFNENYSEEIEMSNSFLDEELQSKKIKLDFIIESGKVAHKPEVNDELAQMFQFETLKQMKEKIQTAIQKRIDIKTLVKNTDVICAELAKQSTFSISQNIIMNQTQMDLQNKLQMLISQKRTFDQFIAEKGLTEDNFMEVMAQESRESLEKFLISQKLMKEYQIESSEQEIESFLNEIVEMEVANQQEIKNYYKSNTKYLEALKERLNTKKLAEILMQKVSFKGITKIDLENNAREVL